MASFELVAAALTRAAASFTEASGKPTSTKAGKLLEMSVSTSISRPTNPKRLIDKVFASNLEHLFQMLKLHCSVVNKNRNGVDSNIYTRKLAGSAPLPNQPTKSTEFDFRDCLERMTVAAAVSSFDLDKNIAALVSRNKVYFANRTSPIALENLVTD
jgi:hypothetical protein